MIGAAAPRTATTRRHMTLFCVCGVVGRRHCGADVSIVCTLPVRRELKRRWLQGIAQRGCIGLQELPNHTAHGGSVHRGPSVGLS